PRRYRPTQLSSLNWLSVQPALEVFVELTQVTQYFGFHDNNHQTPTPGVAVNGVPQWENTIPLFAHKPTWLRVHARDQNLEGGAVHRFHSTVTLLGGANKIFHSSKEGTLGGNSKFGVQQGRTQGAEIIIPWDLCAGTLNLSVLVTRLDGPRR